MSGNNATSDSGGSNDNNNNNNNVANIPAEPEPMLVQLAGVVGNMMEWYDFSCFGFFADIIGEQFFPPDEGADDHSDLVKSFAVFGAAFLVRPIGGALIGQHGDNVGRKSALEASIFLMAFPTFALGCLPTYSQIAWGATALLVICRLLQGLSVGGQLMSSLVFTLERKPREKWGLWGAGVFAASGFGITVGSLLSFLLRNVLTEEQLLAWGWRVPFLLGALAAIPGFYLKKYGREHPLPNQEQEQLQQQSSEETHGGPPRRQKSVIAETLGKDNRRALIAGSMVPALPAAAYYIVFIWLVMYMEEIVTPPVPYAFAINSVTNILGTFATALGGLVADCYPHYSQIMIFSAICLAISCPLLIRQVGFGDPVVAFVCQMTMGIFLCLWNGAMLPWLVLAFPARLRLTSVSIGYNIAVGIFGGFAPAFATLLVTNFSSAAPGYYVTALAILSIIGIFVAPGSNEETVGESPSGEGISMVNTSKEDKTEAEII